VDRQQGSSCRRGARYLPARALNPAEVAWLSGLLEGEGYFGLVPNRSGGRTYRYARVGLTMTDRDVVGKTAALMDAGVSNIKPSGVSRLPQFRAVVQGRRAVALMRLWYPTLGQRRRSQIETVLDYEATRSDPNQARREWSSEAVRGRNRDLRGRLTAN
jgi:hypothetical protein